ncbi:MAG: chemotaxis protein CheA [Gammaproteobacteria bacterium]|nr:chemotaxis protein CheA [Gammaproteobacteria bacterium]
MDDELLQDFLVEAGEILEQLNEQLVDLEQSPDDKEMLNAVFRGFHTIKGGAGFLNIEPMVIICHRSEDVFNLLRNGERHVTPELMDTVLPVLDILNAQFEALRAGDSPEAADPALIARLEAIIKGETPAPKAAPAAAATAPEPAPPASAAADFDDGFGDFDMSPAKPEGELDITDEEFESLLDALQNPKEGAAAPEAKAEVAGDEISEDEFEALLDELHGKGKFDSSVKAPSPIPAKPAEPEPAADVAATHSESDDITDDEFEALLDDIHGKGKFETGKVANGAAEGKPAPAAKPAVAAAASSAADNKAKEKPAAQETTVRVDTKRLDDIMNMVGELVLVRNRIDRLGNVSGNEELLKAVANLDLVTTDLQMAVMKTRMQPIKKVFGRFPRVVRDLARSLKKEIRLEMIGEETDLDKNLVEALADPLVHLVRNAVDHGIEMPNEREAAGKTREGTVVLTAAQEGDHILLTIEDDGKGMDPAKLRAKAVEKGLMDTEAAARLDNKEVFNLIFMPGFSTKDQISDISGRGVGMDVVKTRIAQLNGTVEIDSTLGKGSRLSIKLPLTLAIMPTLMVQLEKQLFALPLVNVNEIFHLDLTKTNVVDGQLCVVIRDRTLPLYYLRRWLVRGYSNAKLPADGHVVVVQSGTQKVGFLVDELIGQEEVVIKPLGALLQGTAGLAGATITGDGGIAIILDIPGLMRRYAARH